MARTIRAGDSGEAGGVCGGAVHGSRVFTVELDFNIRQWSSGIAGEGVNEGFLWSELPCEADVGELKNGLRVAAAFAARAWVGRACDVDEERGFAQFFRQ
jgi:hypothetical protein